MPWGKRFGVFRVRERDGAKIGNGWYPTEAEAAVKARVRSLDTGDKVIVVRERVERETLLTYQRGGEVCDK